jgi:HD superfamily phosphohydrolase YqeK
MTKEERIKKYLAFMDNCADFIPVETLDKLGFFTAPASTKYHGAYEGGLFDHSLETATALVALTEKLNLTWETNQSAKIVGMYHDLCKYDNYVKINHFDELVPVGIKYKHNPEVIIPGHGDKSVIIAQKHIELTDEEIACIRWHMGAFETDPKNWEYYGRAIEKYPNVLYTHTADMIASKIIGI